MLINFSLKLRKEQKKSECAVADIDGIKGNQNIANMFYEIFSSISGKSNYNTLPYLSNLK